MLVVAPPALVEPPLADVPVVAEPALAVLPPVFDVAPPAVPVVLPPLLVVFPPVLPVVEPPRIVVVPPAVLLSLLVVIPPLLAPPLAAGPAPPTDVADFPPDDEWPPESEPADVRWQAEPHTTTPHKTNLSQVMSRMFRLPYPSTRDHVDQLMQKRRRRHWREM
jgi:hypothetical protein